MARVSIDTLVHTCTITYMDVRLSSAEARRQWGSVLKAAQQGTTTVITVGGYPVAQLGPLTISSTESYVTEAEFTASGPTHRKPPTKEPQLAADPDVLTDQQVDRLEHVEMRTKPRVGLSKKEQAGGRYDRD